MFNQSPEVLSQQFLPAGGVPLAHIVIDASYGHDSFLLEESNMTRHIRAFFERAQQAAA